MSLQTSKTSFHGTSISRRVSIKLLRKDGDPIVDSRYIVVRQDYLHSDLRMLPPDQWAFNAYSQIFFTNSNSFTLNQTVLLKTNSKTQVGRLSSPGILTTTDYSQKDFEEPLKYALIESSQLDHSSINVVYSHLHPAVRQLGNRLFGLRAPFIYEQVTALDTTTTYCIRAKNNEEDVFFIWLNDRDFQISRVIKIPNGSSRYDLHPYGHPSDGYLNTSLDFSEQVYSYLPDPTEENFTTAPEMAMDFSLPANRTQFLAIADIIKLAADQFEPTNDESPVKPRADKSWSSDLRKGLLVVETGKGPVSGFIVRIKDTDFAAANLRSLNSDSRIVLKTLAGTEVPYTAIYGVIGRDIVLFKISKNNNALRLASDPQKTTKLGQRIVLLGNKPGDDVLNDHPGLLMYMGRDRFETHRVFSLGPIDNIPRPSGSPIISDDTGEVLGIASYRQSTWIDIFKQAATNEEIRRNGFDSKWFGFRLDGDLQFQAINLNDWNDQRKRIEKFKNLSDLLLSAMKLRTGDLKEEPRLSALFTSFTTRTTGAGKDAQIYTDEAKRISKSLRLIAEEELPSFTAMSCYDYYRTCLYWDQNVLDQIKYRTAIISALKRYEENPATFSDRLRQFSSLHKK